MRGLQQLGGRKGSRAVDEGAEPTGIYGIDTRELTKVLRDHGSMKGCIIPEGAAQPAEGAAPSPADVCCAETIVYPAEPAAEVENINGSKAALAEGKKVVVVDCGVKHSIIRNLIARGAEVIRVPFDYDFTDMEYDGVYVYEYLTRGDV